MEERKEGRREGGREGGRTAYLHVDVRLLGEAVLGKEGAGISDLAEADAHQVFGEGQAL